MDARQVLHGRASRGRHGGGRGQPVLLAWGIGRRVSALVADDEPFARSGLKRMLAEFDWIDCIGEAASGATAVEAIDRLRPDLVFFDIRMPGATGLQVLERIAPVTAAEISWLEAMGDYVVVHAAGGKQVLHITLAQLESRLDPRHFRRVHRAHIVNLEHVAAFRRLPGGALCASFAPPRVDVAIRIQIGRGVARRRHPRARSDAMRACE